MSCETEFLVSIKPLFDDFMIKFQTEEPMIHMLHINCQQPLKELMGRLLKSACFSNKEGKELTNINVDDVSLQLGIEDFKTMQGPKRSSFFRNYLKVLREKLSLVWSPSTRQWSKICRQNYHWMMNYACSKLQIDCIYSFEHLIPHNMTEKHRAPGGDRMQCLSHSWQVS